MPLPQLNNPQNIFLESSNSTSDKLRIIHDSLMKNFNDLDRIAVAMYDEKSDMLKTFINSTRQGYPIEKYEFKLSDCYTLNRLSKEGVYRVIDDIPDSIIASSPHSDWLLKQGYYSSFTVPIYDNGHFLGMIFFDSVKSAAFSSKIQRDLLMYSSLINMIISEEISAVRSIVTSAKVAREISNLRDFETGAHLERMARFARIIALELAESHNLSDEFIEHLYLFAPLHDIGKIGIPDKILLKPGKFDEAEITIMKGHVTKGVELVEKILGGFALTHLPDSIILKNIIGCHHEFLDGSGYPHGLRGDEIPIEARIVTASDIYDALTSVRPYKKAWSPDSAIDELTSMVRQGKLDPDCIQAIRKRLPDLVDITSKFAEIK
ncbi:MAG: HD-GYP domain-containing protein [Gallionella sp.]|jgi:HD-GYP domain-containing protein (c-di-GMP phosphodiesterase class II)